MVILSVGFIILPLNLKENANFDMVELSVVWLLADLLTFPLDLFAGSIADSLNPWGVTIFGHFVMFSLLLTLGMNLQYASVDIVVTVLLILMGSTMGGLLGPSFSKLLTEMERVDGQGLYQDLWAYLHFLTALSIAVGSTVGGYGYEKIGFHALISSVAVVGFIVTLLVAIATWKLHKTASTTLVK